MKLTIQNNPNSSWRELEVWDDEKEKKIGFIDLETAEYIKHLAGLNQIERDKLAYQEANKNAPNTDRTSLQGHITTTYAKLVEAFGEPTSQGDGCKVDAMWELFTDTGVATIYNYKNGRNYAGAIAPAVKDITDWNIGGHDKHAADWVRGQLGLEAN